MGKKKTTNEKTAASNDSTKNASTPQPPKTIRTRIIKGHAQSPWWIGEVYDLTPHDRAWADERGMAEDAD